MGQINILQTLIVDAEKEKIEEKLAVRLSLCSEFDFNKFKSYVQAQP